MSIFGWKYEAPLGLSDEEHPALLRCDFCGRKCSIKAYQTIKGDQYNLDQDVGSTPGLIDSFDPLEEHKYFCKWGRSPSLAGDKEFGWKICIEMLRFNSIKGKKDDEMVSELEPELANPEEDNLVKEQTQFKLDIINKIQQLKKIKETTSKKYDEIVTMADRLQLDESNRIENVIKHHKANLAEIAKELDLKFDPTKKIKPNEF